ncbi:hypothetical protein [Agromyces subbeticus]|uniref:hypothetical protein n=1 Tax=Agromyces subbeticus TaxID=293890 RepID=UPI00047A269B|nr:hypothetical protein [Agromyces subbeticus]
MSLSRKRRKELKRLQSHAGELWEDQQHVLEHANAVAREASRQLGQLTREEVVPRVRTGYESYVRPGVQQAGRVARTAGDTVERTVGNALGSVLSIGDIANDARVRRAIERVSPRAAAVVKQKNSPGVGTYLAIGAGIIAAAGVAYAVWQTFRADDELWVADDEPTPASPSDV